jgi:Pseudomonas avirulence D protein (AvrD).
MLENKIFSSIDDLIGNSEGRYFGEGYKKVRYTLVKEVITDDVVEAVFSIKYPENWSVKDKNKKIIPHLSSVDSIISTIKLIEDYMLYELKLDESIIRKSIISEFTVKAGRLLYENLENIPASLIYKDEVCDNANKLFFKGKLAQFNITAQVILPISLEEYYEEPVKLYDYYFEEFKNTKKVLTQVSYSPERDKITGRAKLSYSKNLNGIEAEFIQKKSILPLVDGIVISAELTEGLLAKLDNTPRENSKTLIMRKIKCIRMNSNATEKINHFKAYITKTQIANVNGKNMRMSDMEAVSDGFKVIYSVAQEL